MQQLRVQVRIQYNMYFFIRRNTFTTGIFFWFKAYTNIVTGKLALIIISFYHSMNLDQFVIN